MRDLKLFQSDDDPETKLANCNQAIDEIFELRSSPAWSRMDSFIQEEINRRADLLERSAKEDERHRGALEILRFIKEWPERLERLAIKETNKHRGT